jgi:hypothetical protein
MDSMDNFRERFEALAQQMEQRKHQTQILEAHTRTVERRLRWGRITWHVAAVAALGLALALPLTVQAKTFHCGAGDVQCLIDAINEANANGQKNTIRLEAGTYTLTAVDNFTFGRNGLPVITSTLTITGQGAETTIIERDASAPFFRILNNAGTLTLKRLTLRGGDSGTVIPGGGIFNAGTLALAHVTVANNFGAEGGGIYITSGTATIAHSIIAGNFGDHGSGGLAIDHGTLTLIATTVTHNNAFDAPGGIRIGLGSNNPPLPLAIITESTIDHNNAGSGGGAGGGLANFGGTLVITNTTIAANTDIVGFGALGGGLANVNGIVLLTDSTLAENIAGNPLGGGAGGLFNEGTGTVLLQNTIIARNSAPTGPDCSGPVTSLGTNLIGDPTGCTITLQSSDLTGDPGLDTFTDNGRPGNGHFPLLPTSQAIDAGNDAVCPRTDQLGRRRLGPCDIGAIEFRDKDNRQHDADPAASAQASQ